MQRFFCFIVFVATCLFYCGIARSSDIRQALFGQINDKEICLDMMKDKNACLNIIKDREQWTVKKRTVGKGDFDELALCAELIGLLRCNDKDCVQVLSEKIMHRPTFTSDTMRGLRVCFISAALYRIGEAAIEPVLDECINKDDSFGSVGMLFDELLPYPSSKVIIEDYIQRRDNDLSSEQRNRLKKLKEGLRLISRTTSRKNYGEADPMYMPRISVFVLNHPLYKVRQSSIEDSLTKLEKADWSKPNNETLKLIDKLGELRSVEAIDVLTPHLLLKTETEKQQNGFENLPVAVVLTKIGIPSIWGLLKEIAQSKGDDPAYVETSYKVMSTILPAVAILGFVDEAIEKEKTSEGKARLEKLYPLLPQKDEIDQRIKDRDEQDKKNRAK